MSFYYSFTNLTAGYAGTVEPAQDVAGFAKFPAGPFKLIGKQGHIAGAVFLEVLFIPSGDFTDGEGRNVGRRPFDGMQVLQKV